MQNDRITKLKIDNNPFAKGFRELGQSRIKRKLTSKPASNESSDIKIKTDLFEYSSSVKENQISRKRSNSLTGSTASADDSGNSVNDEISSSSLSGTSSPATSAHEYNPSTYDESDDFATRKAFESNQNMQSMPRHQSNEWIDLMALRYFQASGSYPHQPLFYPGMHHSYDVPFPMRQSCVSTDTAPPAPHHFQPPKLSTAGFRTIEPAKTPASTPRKSSSFSISAILGCES